MRIAELSEQLVLTVRYLQPSVKVGLSIKISPSSTAMATFKLSASTEIHPASPQSGGSFPRLNKAEGATLDSFGFNWKREMDPLPSPPVSKNDEGRDLL